MRLYFRFFNIEVVTGFRRELGTDFILINAKNGLSSKQNLSYLKKLKPVNARYFIRILLSCFRKYFTFLHQVALLKNEK